MNIDRTQCGPGLTGAVRGGGGGYTVSMLVLAAASLGVSVLSALFSEPRKLKRRLSGEHIQLGAVASLETPSLIPYHS